LLKLILNAATIGGLQRERGRQKPGCAIKDVILSRKRPSQIGKIDRYKLFSIKSRLHSATLHSNEGKLFVVNTSKNRRSIMKFFAALLTLATLPAQADSQNECLQVCQTSFNYCIMHMGNSDFGIEICSDSNQMCVNRCTATPNESAQPAQPQLLQFPI
jgi:hypothetical protein